QRGEIGVLDGMREHWRPERRRIARRRLLRAAFEPGEQLGVGRRQPGPQQFDLVRLFLAKRGHGGLGEPRRYADAHRSRQNLQKRPAPGLVETVEPARDLRRQLRLAEGEECFDDGGEGGGFLLPSPRERSEWWGGVGGGGYDVGIER